MLPVKERAGTRLPPPIVPMLRVRGGGPASVIVIAAPPRLRSVSPTRGLLETHIAVVNTRGSAPARAVAPRVLPSFVMAIGKERTVKTQAGRATLEASIGLTSGGGKPLAGAGRRNACMATLARVSSQLHVLRGPRAFNATQARTAWEAGWGVGCGEPTPAHLLRYIEMTGRHAACTAFSGFNAMPLDATENRFDLHCPKLEISTVSILDPGRLGAYTRWSEWAVVDVGLAATGRCSGIALDPWGVGFRCDLPHPITRGSDFLVDFGPVLPAGSLLLVHLRDSDGTVWFTTTTVTIDPPPALANGTARQQAVLTSSQIGLRPLAAFDVVDGRVDSRVLVTLLELAQRLQLGGVGPFISGHPYFIAGTDIPSNHAFGRAIDIGSVGGEPVSVANAAAREVVHALVSLPAPLRPDEIGCPFADLGDLPGVFSNADHQDHLHIGFDR